MAVHVLAVLAYKERQRATSQLLADSINTNPVIVRRLLLTLQKAGFVETRKGAGFGSRLLCPPEGIHLADIYRAVEEDEPFSMPARKPNPRCPVGKGIEAALEKIFSAAQEALKRELAQTSLADILESLNPSSLAPSDLSAAALAEAQGERTGVRGQSLERTNAVPGVAERTAA